QHTIFIKAWCFINDIITVPFVVGCSYLHQWRALFVYAPSLPVDVGRIVVIVQYLYFISALQKYAAVSTPLAFAFYDFRTFPFYMELKIFKYLFGLDVACFRFNL